ncbi:hypothetical protein [Pasteurella sp. PK-2025]|uniref:hypothetical protein n=1 Tax=Pasteurella sp. PK-2025 TaxID=3413133 RepID=UPI003C78FD11
MSDLAPIDIIIFEKLLNRKEFNILQVVPSICIQDFILNKENNILPSTLEYERSKNYPVIKDKKSRNLFIRILREIKRPFYRTYKKIKLSFLHELKFIK